MQSKIHVAVLGATGAVGQRFVQLLHQHPFFELVALTASDRSEGKRYGQAAHWVIEGDIPREIADMTLLATDPVALLVERFGDVIRRRCAAGSSRRLAPSPLRTGRSFAPGPTTTPTWCGS